jgi:AAA15 family ATPase/GTPase
VTTSHRQSGSDRFVEFDLARDESFGTQRFFALAGQLLDVLENGSLLVVDEFDASLHPWLTRSLVQLFHSLAMNKNGSQLVFTTHDSTLMDSDLFRRDQIWLTEKTNDGATRLYSLDDFRSRGTEAFAKRYLAGRYGGVPNLGPSLEDGGVL